MVAPPLPPQAMPRERKIRKELQVFIWPLPPLLKDQILQLHNSIRYKATTV